MLVYKHILNVAKMMTVDVIFTLVLSFWWHIFMNIFHAVNKAVKQRQYCNMVRPQLNSDRFNYPAHDITNMASSQKTVFKWIIHL